MSEGTLLLRGGMSRCEQDGFWVVFVVGDVYRTRCKARSGETVRYGRYGIARIHSFGHAAARAVIHRPIQLDEVIKYRVSTK